MAFPTEALRIEPWAVSGNRTLPENRTPSS